jgi:hypothetical protein
MYESIGTNIGSDKLATSTVLLLENYLLKGQIQQAEIKINKQVLVN